MRKEHQPGHAAAPGCLPAPGRRRGQQWRSGLLRVALLAAVLQPGCCAQLKAGDAQDRAFEDLSMLARAGQVITDAMVDTAAAIGGGRSTPTSDSAKQAESGSDAQVLLGLFACRVPAVGRTVMTNACMQQHALLVFSLSALASQSNTLAGLDMVVLPCSQQDGKRSKKHGGVPFWFKGSSGHKAEAAKSASVHLEGNRRMLRRQRQHHHSAEDEWLKVHRWAAAVTPVHGRRTVLLSMHIQNVYIYETDSHACMHACTHASTSCVLWSGHAYAAQAWCVEC